MAHTLGPRNRTDFPLYSENASPAGIARAPLTPSGPKVRSALGQLEDLNVGALQNISQNISQNVPQNIVQKSTPAQKRVALSSVEAATPDSLAADLENFHIRSPGRHSDASVESTETCELRSVTTESASPPPPPLQAPAPEQLASLEARNTLSKHDAGEFDCILSLSGVTGSWTDNKSLRRICSTADLADSASRDRAVHFGCNLVRQRSLSKSDLTGRVRTVDTFTLVATSLDRSPTPAGTQHTASGASPAVADMTGMLLAPEGTGPLAEVGAQGQNGLSPRGQVAHADATSRDRAHSIPRSPCSSVSRIEDTIEELDKLEDEFEAVKQLVQVDRVPSPEKKDVAKKQTTANAKSTAKKPVGTKTQAPATNAGAAPTASNKRLSTARPASLLPPKPLAKSSKPPTKPAFELPGEAVARRLREQREARQAAAAAAEAEAARKARMAAKPKRPTIPTFELPGEAISRRKREEHQAKIKQQEEEERKRREFKARPIRFSITPSTVPRDTISSRARLNRASIVGTESLGQAGPGAAASKRLSVMSLGSTGRPTGAGDVVGAGGSSPRGRGRGRDSTPGSLSLPERTSRATSASTGSVSGISGPRSSVSADDVHSQKQRGKEICQRDNLLSADREREQRERVAAATQARREAAERSRALSRAWAEKQKLRAAKGAKADGA